MAGEALPCMAVWSAVQAGKGPAPMGTQQRAPGLVAIAGSPGGAEMQILRDRLFSLWGCGCDGRETEFD